MRSAKPGQPLVLRLYAAAASAAEPIVPAILRRRARRGKEDPARLSERLGRAGQPRPDGRLAWLHGVSVGESLALIPLARRLSDEHPDLSLLVTSATLTAAEILAGRLPRGAIHQYAPVDTPGAVAAFLDHWRPDLAVFVESEIWPNLILGAKARGAKLALVSARLSSASVNNWRRAPAAARAVFGAFDLVLARDEAAAAALGGLGATVGGVADLKFGAAPLPADEAASARLRTALGGRPVLLAASTHPGEEGLVLDAFEALSPSASAARLVLAPRHPARGAEIEARALRRGFTVTRQSRGDAGDLGEVHVVDAVGELGIWYRLAAIAFVGGSLAPGNGGHNPLEPARLGCPIVVGPHTDAWPVYDALERLGGTSRVGSAAALSHLFGDARDGGRNLRAKADAARQFVADEDARAQGALDRIVAMLRP